MRGKLRLKNSSLSLRSESCLKFPVNPTKSYRSRNALRIIYEVTDWQGHSPEQLNAMKEYLERLKQPGIEAIED